MTVTDFKLEQLIYTYKVRLMNKFIIAQQPPSQTCNNGKVIGTYLLDVLV